MAEEHSGTIDERDHGETTAEWRRTLWAMVGIQFINTMAFSVLSPIMPLFLPVLGRNGECCRSVVRHPQRRHLLHRGLRLAAMGTRRRPPRPLMLQRPTLAIGALTALMALAANIWQLLRFAR